MTSSVDIANYALNKIGASNIISFTEDSKAARIVNQRYDAARDAVFRAHPWNCLIRRAELAASATAPTFGYTKQYTLPTDPYCLRLLSFWNSNVNNEIAAYDSQIMYKVEGRKILSNEDTCKIVYVGRIEDTESYDSMLSSTIASALAAETAYAIQGR